MTTSELTLHEAGGRIAPREDLAGPVYKIRIMGWEPGAENVVGSSAVYPVEALKNSIPAAFPEGTRQRGNHDGMCDEGGDVQRLMAKTTATPWAEADGMYTFSKIAPAYADTIAHFAESIGVSISAAGEMVMIENEDGDMVTMRDEETGLPILKRLFSAEESPYNAIDFVEAPGADGRIVALVTESIKKDFREMNVREQATFASTFIEKNKTSEAVPPQINKEETHMDEAEKEAFAASIVTRVSEALRPKETPVEVRGEDVAEAAVAAGIPKGLRPGVYEAVRGGKTIEAAVAEAKAIADELRAEVKAEIAKESASVAPGYTSGLGAGFSESKSMFDELDQIAGVK